MIVHDVQQATPEWFDVRRGVFTASIASKLLTPTGKLSAQRHDEVARLVAERLGLQEPSPPISTEWIDRGIQMEAEARDWFQFATGEEVEPVGFVTASFSDWLGCSPDSLVHNLEPLELKCPKPSTHLKWMANDGIPKEHVQQVHFQMVVCGSDIAHFMSYCPPMPPIIVVEPESDYTRKMEDAMLEVASELKTLYLKTKGAIA